MSTQAPEAPTAPAADTTPAPAAPPAPAPAPPAVPASPPADTTDWKAEAERWKAQARQNEQRSKANHAELTQRDNVLRLIAEKVGVPFDDKPDPEALTQRLAEQTTLARQRAVELAVYHAAGGVADPGLLLDSREFMNKTAALDPDAADFTDKLAQIVADAAKSPRYQSRQPAAAGQPAAQPPVPALGGETATAPAGSRLWTQADYDNFFANGGSTEAMNKAIDAGLLVNLGVGPRKHKSRQ